MCKWLEIPLKITNLLVQHPLTVHSFARLLTLSGTPDKADNPNTDPMSPSQLLMCSEVRGSAPGGWESPPN